jgi:hypothetical protein
LAISTIPIRGSAYSRRRGRAIDIPELLSRIRRREIARLVLYRHGEWPDSDDAEFYLLAA